MQGLTQANEAYIGNLVQFRQGSISYKNRKQIKKPEDEWIRVENTHEPLVSMEQWNIAQKLAERSRTFKSNKDGEISLFSGLLECADCHKGMKIARDYNVRKNGHRNNRHAYICGTYSRGGANACTPHRTLQSIFVELVLEDIKEKAQAINFDEEKIVSEIRRKKNASSADEQKDVTERLKSVEKRLIDLDKLTKNLYEEMILGDIPRETILGMIENYKNEKSEKLILKEELEKKKTHSQSVESDISEWVSLMKKYTNVETLDRDLLIKLIHKIIVGQKKVVDGVEQQEISIIYNFVGEV